MTTPVRVLPSAAWAIAVLLLGIPALQAQTPSFSASTEVVRVDVLVSDGHGPVVGLEAADFELLDSGVVQKVELVTDEKLPVSVVLALDTSGSVSGERFAELRAASRAIAGALDTGDKAGLLTFSSTVSVRTDLAEDVERLRVVLEAAPVTGYTALVDATHAAIVIGESGTGRALVILLSDGVDTASFLRPESVLETAQRSDTVVYGVSLSPLARSSFVARVCAATGGRVLKAASTDRIRETFLRVLEEFRHRYLLSYTPQDVPRGGWHTLKVRVRKRRVSVEARPGYLAGP